MTVQCIGNYLLDCASEIHNNIRQEMERMFKEYFHISSILHIFQLVPITTLTIITPFAIGR